MRHEEVDLKKFEVSGEAAHDQILHEVGYDSKGISTYQESERCVAKKTVYASGDKCWVRFATVGPNAGSMYDPAKAEVGDLNRERNWRGTRQYEFRPVKPEAFSLYLQFLQTANPSFLRQAERVI